MKCQSFLRKIRLAVCSLAACGLLSAVPAAQAQFTKFVQDFEVDTAGINNILPSSPFFFTDPMTAGAAARVTAGDPGFMTPGDGSTAHAIFGSSPNAVSAAAPKPPFPITANVGPITDFNGASSVWPSGITVRADVFIDPAWPIGSGFDWAMGISRNDGGFLRGFVFRVTKDTSSGDLLLTGMNNTDYTPYQRIDNEASFYTFGTGDAGWYTLEHTAYEAGDGTLAVDMNLLDMSGNTLFSRTRNDSRDIVTGLGANVGGNRSGWFTHINVPGDELKVDNITMLLQDGPSPSPDIPEPKSAIILAMLGAAAMGRRPRRQSA